MKDAKKSEEDLLTAVRATLDEGCDKLDDRISNRLARMRHAAMEKSAAGARRRWHWRLAPAVACLVVFLVGDALFMRVNRNAMEPGIEVADFEIITATEAPDFYAELDFYLWLAETGEHAG